MGPAQITDQTRRRLKGAYLLREIDLVRVKGSTRPVALHEVIDHYPEGDFPNVEAVQDRFATALLAYRNRDFTAAIAAFNAVLELHPDDRASRYYLERCAYLRDNPPAEDWDGVWQFTSV